MNVHNSVFSHIKWPMKLDPQLEIELLSIASIGETIDAVGLKTGQLDVKGIAYFIDGITTVSIPNLEMQSLYGTTLKEGDWFGALSINAFSDPIAIVEELEPSRIIFFPKKELMELAAHKEQVYRLLYNIVSNNLPKWFQAPVTARHGKVIRIAYSLLQLCENTNQGMEKNSIRITQHQLANLTGLSRPRVNKALQIMAAEKLISTNRGRINIDDKSRLGEILRPLNLSLYSPSY